MSETSNSQRLLNLDRASPPSIRAVKHSSSMASSRCSRDGMATDIVGIESDTRCGTIRMVL